MKVRVRDGDYIGSLPISILTATGFPASQAGNGNVALLVHFGGLPSHGVVLSDASGLTLVAGGCPAGMGCGDPTPIGGTFSTMIHAGENVPVVNARGDVLFLSDVEGGSSTRGYFLYERATHSIHNVAALGDPTPTGGTFGSVGLGTLNDQGEVVLHAWKTSAQDSMILRWQNGILQKVVAIGDSGPNGSVFVNLSRMWFGIPSAQGWPPRIRADGHVFFGASTNIGSQTGLFEEHNGQFTQLAIDNDPAPGGGVFNAFDIPIPNDQGEIAFTARPNLGTSHPFTWFRGRPGQWERVIGVGDVLNGKTVEGMGGSGGPYSTQFDAAGNLLIGVLLRNSLSVQTSAVLIARRGLAPEILLETGDVTPLGPIMNITGYPSMTPFSLGLVGMGVSTPNGPVDVHFEIDICVPPDATTYCTAKPNSAGCVPRITAIGIPSAGAHVGFVVQAEQVLNTKRGVLLYGFTGQASNPFGGGTLCVQAPLNLGLGMSAGGTLPPASDCSGVFSLDMNAFAANQLGGTPAAALSLPGTTVRCQWLGRDPGFAAPSNVQLSDAVEYNVTP